MPNENEEFEFRLRAEKEANLKTKEPQKSNLGIQPSEAPISEAGINLVSGMLATPVSGLAGLGALATKSMGLTDADHVDVIKKVQNALTYEPRSEGGKKIAGVIAYPFEKLGELADYAGGKVTDITSSPVAGTAVNTAIQASPALLGVGRRAVVEKPMVETSAARAERVLTDKTDINWSNLPLVIRKKLTTLANDAVNFEKIDSDTLKNVVQRESLPVPITDATKGQITRDPSQLRTESQVASTKEGTPIRDVYLNQNERLLENLDLLKNRTGIRAPSETEVGRSVVDKTLKAKEEQSNKKINKLYLKAKAAGETEALVSINPLVRYLTEHDDPAQVSYVMDRLNRFDAIAKNSQGDLLPTKDLSINQLESIRRAASAASKDGGTKGHYAGELKSVIDKITSGAGGDLYKQARQARIEHANRFEEPKAISQLVENKSRTDRQTALEDVWKKTIVDGSIDDLKRVRSELLVGEGSRKPGRQAWKDLAGQTIDKIKEDATKSATLDERRNSDISPSALKRSLDKIGDEKLELIFGKSGAKKLRDIAEVAADLKTKPPSRLGGSDTSANILNMLDNIIGKVPLVGNVTRGSVKVIKELNEKGAVNKKVNEALKLPELPKQKSDFTLRKVLDVQKNPIVPLSEISQEQKKK